MDGDGNRGRKWKYVEVDGVTGSFHVFHDQLPWRPVEVVEVEASATYMEASITSMKASKSFMEASKSSMEASTYFHLLPWK